MIGEKKIIAFMAAFMEDFASRPSARFAWLAQPTIDNSAAIIDNIDRINATIAKLNAGITKADIDYYSHGALDEDSARYHAIVSALKKQIIAARAEITALQDRLHEEERNSQREQRLDDITKNAMRYLEMDDIRTANAWLRERFAVTIETRRVTNIELLF